MKLRDAITICETPLGIRCAELKVIRLQDQLHPQSDAELKTELLRDVMHELGLDEAEAMELERREEEKANAANPPRSTSRVETGILIKETNKCKS